MFERVRLLLELVRFSHTVFALPFALLAAVLAWNQPDSEFRWRDLVGIVLCMVLARSAAMSFNRLVDRDIDAQNPRTQGRHIPAGLIRIPSVWMFTGVCSAGFIASTLLFLPKRLPVILAVPVLLFLLVYSYSKRWTSFCHYWLSAALMLSPVAAWIAVRDELALIPTLLAGVVFFWVGGFDIIYACQDREFDCQRGLHSVPVRWGIRNGLRVAMLSHFAMMLSLAALWYYASLGPVFLTGIVLVGALLTWEHWLVNPNDLSRVNVAFFNVNAVVSIGLLLTGLIDLYVFGYD